MESTTRPPWYARPLFSVNHFLILLLVIQLGWFFFQKAGWDQGRIPKGWTELMAAAILSGGLALVVSIAAVRWLFVWLSWRTSQGMGQFNMGMVLLGMIGSSILLAQFATGLQAAWKQRATVRSLAAAGGSSDSTRGTRAPMWIVRLLGREFFSRTTSASADTDEAAQHLALLPDLYEIEMSGQHRSNAARYRFPSTRTEVTDHALSHLSELKNTVVVRIASPNVTSIGVNELEKQLAVEHLALTGTSIDDDALATVGKMVNLKKLTINGAAESDTRFWRMLSPLQAGDLEIERAKVVMRWKWLRETYGVDWTRLGMQHDQIAQWGPPRRGMNLTDAGLAHLNRLTELESLELDDTEITGSGLRHMAASIRLGQLSLSHTALSDEGLRGFPTWNRLRILSLDNTSLTDDGLRHLESVFSLMTLGLDGTNIDGSGLRHLGQNTLLDTLRLGRTRMGDEQMEHLKAFPQLVQLDLAATQVTDAGLVHLAGMRRIRNIRLAGTKVTGEGLSFLEGRRRIERLDLSECPIDEAAFTRQAALFEVWSLDLSYTPVTDAVLEPLKKWRRLRYLNLTGTKATEVGIKAFEQAHPNCEVTR